ncbi:MULTISPECIES: HlyD family secretion protein [unclassified Pannonibacter]|uniref:HlyD family secretion protein n=1 Tax=unclassified Pannonibacter TaxID=2627228 RepID=UPI001AD8C3D5|nr:MULTISPECIES: HlyD family secretion protein [unclassified Pannonibacter]
MLSQAQNQNHANMRDPGTHNIADLSNGAANEASTALERNRDDQRGIAPPKKIHAKRSTLIIMLLVFLAGGGVILWAWNLFPFKTATVTTDNSYVKGQVTVLASQVSGYITSTEVRDYQHVKAGDVLYRIDDRIFIQQLHQAEAQLAGAKAKRKNLEQTIAQKRAAILSAEAGVAQAQAENERAANDLNRIRSLHDRNVSSQRELDQARSNASVAEANLKRSEAELENAHQALLSAEISTAQFDADVDAAKASVELARINLSNTTIRAPRDGQISEASARTGQYVSVGSQMTYLVPDKVWVVANFKETQTANMQVGDPAHFTVDGANGIRLTGHVEEISPATGSEFSVLRADNASGNFTKVVQRLPVRISIDDNQPALGHLRPGMSVVTSVEPAGTPPERR